MLRDQSATCAGWQLAQTLGSLSSDAVSFFSLPPQAPSPSVASSSSASAAQRDTERAAETAFSDCASEMIRVVFPIDFTGIDATEYEPRRRFCVRLAACSKPPRAG